MTRLRWPGAAGLVVAGVLLTSALVAASALVVPAPPQRTSLPTAGELMALERYLDPADLETAETPGVPQTVLVRGDPFRVVSGRWEPGQEDGAGAGEGWRPGEQGPAGSPGGAGENVQRPRWTLSAVLLAGDRRTAILNDRMVRPGDRLDDGTRVETVERTHIVIITPDGERRRLELEEGQTP